MKRGKMQDEEAENRSASNNLIDVKIDVMLKNDFADGGEAVLWLG
jgi:hypothetical protein